MKLPAPVVRSWADVQRNFDFLVGRSQAPIVIPVNGLGSVDLGPVPGESITGVRVTLAGQTAGTGGNTYIRLRPNGLASITANQLTERTYWDGAVQNHDAQLGGNTGGQPGLIICATDWGVGANSVHAFGVLNTKIGTARAWTGIYSNQDVVTNGSRILSGRVLANWNEGSTPITSLLFALDAGTFTGRIVLEMLP
jgi:hypothetical protein